MKDAETPESLAGGSETTHIVFVGKAEQTCAQQSRAARTVFIVCGGEWQAMTPEGQSLRWHPLGEIGFYFKLLVEK